MRTDRYPNHEDERELVPETTRPKREDGGWKVLQWIVAIYGTLWLVNLSWAAGNAVVPLLGGLALVAGTIACLWRGRAALRVVRWAFVHDRAPVGALVQVAIPLGLALLLV